jgi:hypothetical protein
VIETDCLPFGLIVTGLAFRTVAIRMDILQPVTGHAGTRQVLVELSGMAGCASDILVRAFQSKFRLAMIERLRIAPFYDRMAAVAPLTKPTAMRIDLLVTFETGRRSLAKFDFCDVAAFARYIPVSVDKLVVGKLVVECLTVELVDVGTTSFVVCVTLFAFKLQRVLRSPVNTGPRRTIGGRILVAVKAKLCL